WIDREQPATASTIEEIACPILIGLVCRAVGREHAAIGTGRQRIDRAHATTRNHLPGIGPFNRPKYPDFRATQRHCEPAARQATKRRDRPLKTSDLPRRGASATAQYCSVGEIEHIVDAADILRLGELRDHLSALQQLVRLQRTVKCRHRDRGIAPSKDAVEEVLQGRDHADFPHRRSYWTKFGSAFSSLYLPIRLFRMPPR